MRIRVWGPIELVAGGTVFPVRPPQQAAVLVALAVDAGRRVPLGVLLGRVWAAGPPVHARRTVHTYLTRIRRLLERAGGAELGVRLTHQGAGYVLDLGSATVDLREFRRLVFEARRPGGSAERQMSLLGEALALCRGEPLAGLAGDWADQVREGCRQQRLDAVLGWADAALRCGRAEQTIDTLIELVCEHPLDESAAAMLMRTLHAAGHTADALARYSAARRRLADELGIDPGPLLRQAHESVLRGVAGVSVAALPARAVPAQLPLDAPGFVGRDDELARLDAVAARSGAVVVVAVSGTAGVGKTALAVRWAHRVRDRFPDGQLYVNLRGYDPGDQAMAPAEAVRGFLDALDVPLQRIPAGLDAQAALYRSLLAGKRMLVVLDNARDAGQLRPLLPAAPGCLALVTSRNRLAGLVAVEGAHPLPLDLLTVGQARHLLAARLGADRVTADPAATQAIITSCARLPLALAIVAARAATQPQFGLSVLAAELRAARSGSGLGVLACGDDPRSDLRAVFSWSYQTLSADAARLFRLLGLYPGPDISTPAAASLAGQPVEQTRELLADLARASLIVEHTPGRHTFHDLLRAYATEQAHTHDSDAHRRAAIHRLLDHYLHTAHTANRLLNPHRDPITPAPPQPEVTPEHLADHQQGLAWFDIEHPVLLAALDHAAATGFDTHTWQLAWTLADFLGRRGHGHDWAATHHTALAAARRLGDPSAQAYAHRGLGRAYTELKRVNEAHTQLRHALDLYREIGDQTDLAHTHNSLAALLTRQGRHAEALPHAQQALDLFRAAGHQRGHAYALNIVGWCHTQLGDHQRALTSCQQALTLLQELGDHHGEATTWDSLGHAHHYLGHHHHAITCFHHALRLFRNLANRHYEAATLTRLGDTHHTAGNPGTARRTWQQALEILDDLDHPDAELLRTKLHDLDRPAMPGHTA